VGSKALPGIAHGFTHFKLQIEPLLLEVRKSRRRVSGGSVRMPGNIPTPGATKTPGVVWLSPADAVTAAIPTPVRKILLSI
jgi:A/G-specific adenine glycosylase